MLQARIGTVNSVCGSLIGEFAFELGRSPVAEVIPEERQDAIFARATGPTAEECAPAITSVATNSGIPTRGYSLHVRRIRDWLDDFLPFVNLARFNGTVTASLTHCADRPSPRL